MWRGSGSGELGSIVCQRAAGFSPLNYRSGMFPAADSPSAPTRVGASQAGEGAGRGRGPGLGTEPVQEEDSSRKHPQPFLHREAGPELVFQRREPSSSPGPPAQGAPEGSPPGGGGMWGSPAWVGGRPGPRGWPGLAAAVCPALPFLEGLALWCPLGWDNQHPSTRW